MKIKNNYTLILLSVLTLLSCNVHFEKRHYNRGIFVDITRNRSSMPVVTKSKTRPVSPVLPKTVINPNIEYLPLVSVENDYPIPVPMVSEGVSSTMDDRHVKPVNKNLPDKRRKISSSLPIADSHQNIPVLKIKSGQARVKHSRQETSDSLLYMLSGLIGIAAFGAIRIRRNQTLKISRWANKNKNKTRVIIGLLQIGMGITGLGAGYLMAGSGIRFSNLPEVVSSIFMVSGAAYLLMPARKSEPVSFRSFYLKKLSYLLIGISFLSGSFAMGNKMALGSPQLTMGGWAIEKVNYWFPSGNEKATSMAPEVDNETEGSVGDIVGLIILSIFFLALMVVLSCAAFCVTVLSESLPIQLLSALFFVLFMILTYRGMAYFIRKIIAIRTSILLKKRSEKAGIPKATI